MKLSLIQMESNGTKKENEEKTLKFLKEAVKEDPDIICLSELFLSCGKEFPEYFRELTKNKVQVIFLPSHFRENTGKIAWDILTKANFESQKEIIYKAMKFEI